MVVANSPEIEDRTWTREEFVRRLVLVGGIATELVERWTELDEPARLELVRELQRGLSWHEGNGQSSSAPPLTPRELEVVAALVKTGSTVGVASDLGISESTVRTHVKNVLSKLQVHSRTEAVALMLRDGLLPLHRV